MAMKDDENDVYLVFMQMHVDHREGISFIGRE